MGIFSGSKLVILQVAILIISFDFVAPWVLFWNLQGFLMEDYLMHPHYNNLVHGSTSGWDQSECPTKIRLEIEASPLANKEENYHGYYHGVHVMYYGINRWPQMTSLVMTLGNLGNIQKRGSRINSLLISWDEAPETLWSEV